MLRTKERIQEIKETAYENLMKADNWAHNNKEMTKEKYWSLYRADVRELLSVIEDYEKESKKTLPELQEEIANLMKEDNEKTT